MFATDKTSHFARNQGSASRSQDQSLWAPLVADIGKPETARVIVDLFEQHPSLQQQNPAVFLRAKHTLSAQAKAQSKVQTSTSYTLGKAAASLFTGLFGIVGAVGQSLSVIAQLLLQWVEHQKAQMEARRRQVAKPASDLPAVQTVTDTTSTSTEWPVILATPADEDAKAVRH